MQSTGDDTNRNATPDQLSFGRYLQAIRLEKGISLEEVAKETRIALGSLVLIEEEDHERLPPAVFVKGFLRAYARCIGADSAEVIQSYEARLQVVQKGAESQAGLQRHSPRSWLKLLVALAALLLIVAGLLNFLRFRSSMDTVREPAPAGSPTQGPAVPAEPVEPVAARLHPKSHSLEVTAQEKTWIKVLIDDHDSKQFNLSAGDRLELEASAGFNLLIGNADGITLKLNGKNVAVQGKSGQAVNIDLP